MGVGQGARGRPVVCQLVMLQSLRADAALRMFGSMPQGLAPRGA